MMTRRIFLKNGSLALVSLGFAPTFVARAAQAAQARKKILVTIFQRGAVDGLNTIVPYGEKAYYSSRPSIAIPRPGQNEGAVDLDGFFGLHPRMAALQPYFQNKSLAIVLACGSPALTRSHFDAQDYMESGTPGLKGTRGSWLNRTACEGARTRARFAPSRSRRSSLGRSGHRARARDRPVVAVRCSRHERGDDVELVRGAVRVGRRFAARADGQEAFDAVKMMKVADRRAILRRTTPLSARAGEAMKRIAQLVKADLGLEVAFTELGQWDHHANEGSTQGQIANRLDDFARGIASFAQDLGERMADVMVVTMSEFGRTVKENGNRGTDHGHGNAMLVLGGDVRGGKVYGKWPGLEQHQLWQGRDLAITTDFRDVFTEAVMGHLGAKDISKIFPGYVIKQRLGLV